ncbi:MAG: hypothetical protein ACLTYY_00330, partial [Faecalibacterium prausnitzii]
MTMTSKRIILLAVIIAVAFVLGRLAVREVLNLLLRHAVWREYSVKTLKWGLLYTAAFLAAFVGSALLKMNSDPTHGKYNTRWDETVGKAYTDLPYGEGAANKFDLYVPADKSQDAYGLVVYLHAGGFTGGDKAEDAEMLEWLCSKGYVAAGI